MSDKPRTVMEGTPEAIYLQTGDAGDEDMTFDQLGDVTWAEDWIDRGDTKYIRADVAERELSAARAEAERLREAYELKVADLAAETLRASEFHALLSEVAASLCDTHGNLPKSKQCRYCDLLGRVRAALSATRKDSSNV